MTLTKYFHKYIYNHNPDQFSLEIQRFLDSLEYPSDKIIKTEMNTTPVIKYGRIEKLNETLYSALIIYTKDFTDFSGFEKYRMQN